MSKRLEQIVKAYVPFVNVYDSKGFDYKGRVSLPKSLVEILKQRQKEDEKGKIKLFYKPHFNESPKYLELTDYLPENDSINFSSYGYIGGFKKSNVFLIPVTVLEETGIQKPNSVVFVGDGNKIFVYRAEDYNRDIQPTP